MKTNVLKCSAQSELIQVPNLYEWIYAMQNQVRDQDFTVEVFCLYSELAAGSYL